MPLVTNLESEDELAFVLAHEMAHVMLSHTLNDASEWSASQEVEADSIAALLVSNSGLTPDGGFTFLEKVESDSSQDGASQQIERRYAALAEFVENQLMTESDSRAFTPLPVAWNSAHKRAHSYLADMEVIYSDFLQAQKQAMLINGGRGTDADKSRAEACNEHYRSIYELAKRRGHTALLLHQVLTIGELCSFYVGTSSSIEKYITRYVDLSQSSFSETAAIAVGRLLHKSDKLLNLSAERLIEIAFAPPLVVPALDGMRADLHAADSLASSFLAVCEAVGATNWQPVADKLVAAAGDRYAYMVSVIEYEDLVKSVGDNCMQRINESAQAVRDDRTAIFEQRLDMGHSKEVAYSMAQLRSSVRAVNNYISDRRALQYAVLDAVDQLMD
ncbi:MAG: hypothetical protein Hals2KO_28890 [Halioglobus sp.]